MLVNLRKKLFALDGLFVRRRNTFPYRGAALGANVLIMVCAHVEKT